jgi:acyl carrier protein
MGIVKLVAFLESSFRIQVKDTEVVPEHFESIRALCEFVEKKQRDA